WATDIHLDHASEAARSKFCRSVQEQADALVVTGDIAESHILGTALDSLATLTERPVYFVLGNHDYYRGSVAGTRRQVGNVVGDGLVYLSQTGVVELTTHTALVGHDGWADGRLGDLDSSDVIFNDFLLIDELKHWRDHYTLDKPALRRALEALGDEAAGYLKSVLAPAAEQYSKVIVATHIPPFREAAWYQGRPCADDYLPFLSCKAMGDVLVDVAQSHPKCQILVLCGHTHGGGEVQVAENMQVVTGAAEYGKPAIQQIVLVD
ncbi:MAG: metallophosphoesterase, partial [Thermoguttaceae bacterium]